MSWWHRLLRRKQMEEQLEKELRFHLDQDTAELISQGHDPGMLCGWYCGRVSE